MKIIKVERGMSGAGQLITDMDCYYFEFSSNIIESLEGREIEIVKLANRSWISELRLGSVVIGRITGERVIWGPVKALRKALVA